MKISKTKTPKKIISLIAVILSMLLVAGLYVPITAYAYTGVVFRDISDSLNQNEYRSYDFHLDYSASVSLEVKAIGLVFVDAEFINRDSEKPAVAFKLFGNMTKTVALDKGDYILNIKNASASTLDYTFSLSADYGNAENTGIATLLNNVEGTLESNDYIGYMFYLEKEAVVTVETTDKTTGAFSFEIFKNNSCVSSFDGKGASSTQVKLKAGSYLLFVNEDDGGTLSYQFSLSADYNSQDSNITNPNSESDNNDDETKHDDEYYEKYANELDDEGEANEDEEDGDEKDEDESGDEGDDEEDEDDVVTGVKLDKSSLKLKKGDSRELAAIYTPYDAVAETDSWSNSNNKVITLNGYDDGTADIKAKNLGKATITYKCDGKFTAQCQVTVDTTSLTIKQGKSKSLKKLVKFVSGNKKAKWKSSKKKIVSVTKKGKIKAKKGGKATITAKISGTSYKIIVNVKRKR